MRSLGLAFITLLAPGAAAASPFAYVWSNADTTADSDITVVDLATDQVKTVLEAGNGAIDSVAVSPDGEHLFVAKYNGVVYVYGVNDASHWELYHQDIGSSPSGIAVTPDGTEVYVSHLFAGYVTRLLVADWIVPDDPTTQVDNNRLAYSLAAAIPQGGRHIALNQWGDEAVVAHDGGELSIVDLIAETATTQTNGAPSPGGLALVPGSGLMVVSDPGAGRVKIVTRGGGTVNHTLQEPRGLLARYEGQTLKIQIAEAGADRVATLGGWPAASTGDRPFAVAFSDDEGVLVTANYGDDTVSVLRPTPSTVPIPDTPDPTGITVGPELPPIAAFRFSPIRFTYRLCDELVLGKLEIVNRGAGTLHIGQTFLEGADRKAFAIAENKCADRTVAPGASCAVSLKFTSIKDAGKSGTYRATFTAITSDPKSPTLKTDLIATPLKTMCGG